MRTAVRVFVILAGGLLLPLRASAQSSAGIVVDQTGLPLPGVSIQLFDGPELVATITTAANGAFNIDDAWRGGVIVASLDGFETARVARDDAARIVLTIAHAAETTTVIAPVLPSSSPTASSVGSTLTAGTVARLPSSRLKARESLPLLPSMIRGADGLLRLGGARPYETPLLLDGFNVTNPATGTSNINLPFETVRGVEVLRDPVAVTYGGLIGGVVEMASKPGDKWQVGVQGFVPRPRFASPGFGRLEGIFPRLFAGGAGLGGRLTYFGAIEYDFERIAVPGVTAGSGPNLVEQSATMFGRVDLRAHERYNVTVEGLAFPGTTDNAGLSPLREEQSSARLRQRDFFAGMTHRIIVDTANVLTIRLGAIAHHTTLSPNGEGTAWLSPDGWRSNWFASVDRRSSRSSLVVTWDRLMSVRRRDHSLTFTGRMARQQLRGGVAESRVAVEDAEGRTVRRIDFGPASTIGVADRPMSLAARDVWTISDRLQFDVGARLDHDAAYGGAVASARAGIHTVLDENAATIVRAGYGRFVGSLPLSVQAFAGNPVRADTTVDPISGVDLDTSVLHPAVDRLRFPRARAVTVQLERHMRPGLDALAGVTDRRSSCLATLDVSTAAGSATVRSTGSGSYRELQFSVRKTWIHDQQLFVSYVLASARGELNDFASLFQFLDVPLLQPGGSARLPADARHRWIAWGTFNLPRRIVLSPVIEWHSGFPYSVVDARRRFVGVPNSATFPSFMAADFVVFKTFTVRRRSADLGIQLFNATNHFNPRDVYPVAGAPRFGTFTNSVGPILRGFMLLKW